jgi:hypothetical protein
MVGECWYVSYNFDGSTWTGLLWRSVSCCFHGDEIWQRVWLAEELIASQRLWPSVCYSLSNNFALFLDPLSGMHSFCLQLFLWRRKNYRPKLQNIKIVAICVQDTGQSVQLGDGADFDCSIFSNYTNIQSKYCNNTFYNDKHWLSLLINLHLPIAQSVLPLTTEPT